MKFLDKVANYIKEEEISLENLTIVLPSERARKYLSSSLFNAFQKPIIAPDIITMDRWVKSYSDKIIIDSTRALIELYKIQLVNAKSVGDESFDEFISWGTTLLSDFNEIDRYLLDAKHVFKNLADIKEIEQWSFGEENLTESQQKFMEFWDRFPGYYHELNKRLDEKNTCYAGSAYKHLSNNIQLLFKDNKEQRFLFVGFNALSSSEKSIMKQLYQMGRAEILVDADNYYLDDEMHEAGSFIRDISKHLDGKKLSFVNDTLKTKSLDLTMIECAQNTGQVKVAASLLNEMNSQGLNETLLLLADESLIGSVIKNLPSSIGKANITLGLPIRNTAVKSWVDLLFSIQEGKRKYRTNAIHFNALKNFFNHPFVLAMVDDDERRKIRLIEQAINEQNRVFIKASPIDIISRKQNLKLGSKAQELLDLLINDWQENWLIGVQTIRSLNRHIYKSLNQDFSFEKAAIEAFDKSLIDFENILQEGIPDMKSRSFKQLFNQHWSTKSIAYHGNPMDGLQIMGLLETRALDFKNIICLGMNEGQLPPTNPIQTMIPMDLRKYFGLPSPREKQGLFAHHFYRLLHHCDSLTVTYNTADESIGSSEPSRYLMQLEMELKSSNSNVNIEKKIYTLKEEEQLKVNAIEKTDEIIDRVESLLASSASASMFKKYIACPLDYYFQYVMDFGEAEEVEEEIEHSTFGTFIHETLEELYTPFARYSNDGTKVDPSPRNITAEDIQKMLKDYRMVMDRQFLNHFNNDKTAFTRGKNLLSYQMAMELTKRFLESELAFLKEQTDKVFILSLERSYNCAVEIDIHGKKRTVNLKGYVDRIDQIGDKVRVIDYKSGKVDSKEVALMVKGETDEELIVNSLKNKKHVLQLIQYAYLYYQEHNVIPESSIVSFISNNNVPFTLQSKKVELNQVIKDYPTYLGLILEELFDTSVPFMHDRDKYFSFCKYCE